MTVKDLLRRAARRVPYLGKVMAQRDELRAITNQLWVPPGHFYSPLPAVDALRARETELFDAVPREVPGVDLNEAGQLRMLDALAGYYAEQPFTAGKTAGLRYYFDNQFFTEPDAIFLYGMLRHLRPARYLEVGSGFSSCVVLDTDERFLGRSIRCTFIEPYPDRLLSLLQPGDLARVEILRSEVQRVGLDRFAALGAGDVLFIDSTHVAKTGSDVNYLLGEVLPRLAAGVYIHIHDIFHPFEYPREWVFQGRAWNEAYMLRAFLQYNDAFEVCLSNSFLQRFHAARLDAAMPLCRNHAGASMWLRKHR